MKIIDKIYASFYSFYKKPGKTKFSTPQSYTTYVFTFGILLWLMILDAVINYNIYNKAELSISGSDRITTIFMGLVISGIVYYLFYRRYIKSSRYLILDKQYTDEVKNKHFWRFISIMYILFPLLLFMTLAVVWHKR